MKSPLRLDVDGHQEVHRHTTTDVRRKDDITIGRADAHLCMNVFSLTNTLKTSYHRQNTVRKSPALARPAERETRMGTHITNSIAHQPSHIKSNFPPKVTIVFRGRRLQGIRTDSHCARHLARTPGGGCCVLSSNSLCLLLQDSRIGQSESIRRLRL